MFTRIIASIVSVALLMGSLTTTASAAVIGTSEALAGISADSKSARIEQALSREDVQQAMIRLGVDPEQAQLRVASLDEQQLSQLDAQLASLPAGGSLLALIGAVFVVLLILEITGVIDVFKGA